MSATHVYVIRYRNKDDDACPVFAWHCRAYDRDHAVEKFWDTGDGDDGWDILSVERVKEREQW